MIAKIKTALQLAGALGKSWHWIALAALAFGWLWSVANLHQERADHQATKAQYAHEHAVATAAALVATQRNRALEQELNHATNEHAQAQRKLEVERRARAADARAADGRVRSATQAYASAAGASCTAATATGNEPTAAEALDLLAGLLDRVASRTTALAEFADESHTRATACAADYDRARQAVNTP